MLSEILSDIEPNLFEIMNKPAVPKIRVHNNEDRVSLRLLYMKYIERMTISTVTK